MLYSGSSANTSTSNATSLLLEQIEDEFDFLIISKFEKYCVEFNSMLLSVHRVYII